MVANLVPAAQYLRMSTEHQQYSLDNQSSAIRKHAELKGFEIVQTYSDAAKSDPPSPSERWHRAVSRRWRRASR